MSTSTLSSGMKIEPATEEQWDRFFPLGMAFLHSSPVYRNLEFDADRAKKVWDMWRRSNNHYVRLASIDEKPAGIFVGMIGTYWFSPDLRGEDLLFFVSPEFRGRGIGAALLTDFLEWCREHGAGQVYLFNSSGLSGSADHLYGAVGAVRQGGFYVYRC